MSEPAPAPTSKKITCSTCSRECDATVNFCPNCGSKPHKTAVRTDFEIGRIDALETVKTDLLKWLGRYGAVITLALAILVWIGVDHVITDRVGTKVQDRLQSITKTIDDATAKAYASAARAEIQSEDAQKTIQELDAKKTDLESTINDLNQNKLALQRSISDVDGQKANLATSLSDLQQKETTLKGIIQSENLVTVFAKLRYDLYRVHEITATITLLFVPGSNPPRTIQNMDAIPRMLWFEKSALGLPTDKVQRMIVIELFPTGEATTFSPPAGGEVTSAAESYKMFIPYAESLVNRPIESLNGIQTLRLDWGGSLQSSDEATKAFDAMIGYVRQVQVELHLNGVPLTVHLLPASTLKASANHHTVLLNGAWFAEVTTDIAADYKDVRKLYDSKLIPPSQP